MTRTRTTATTVEGAASTVTCPNCGALSGDTECPRCGHELIEGAPQTTPPPNASEPSSEVADEPELSEEAPPAAPAPPAHVADFPQAPRQRGRPGQKQPQHSMAETAISNGELEPLIRRRAELIEEVEPDEEIKALQNELRETKKRLKQVVVAMNLADGLYRVAGTVWTIDVVNRPAGTKEVTFGKSVELKVGTIE